MLVFLAHTGDKYSHSRKGALYVCWTRHAKSIVIHAGHYTVGKYNDSWNRVLYVGALTRLAWLVCIVTF